MSQPVVSLKRLVPDARFINCDDISVASVVADDRRVMPGDTFVAIRGSRIDGHRFTASAVSNGAASIIAEQEISDCRVPQCVVPSSAAAFARLSMLLQCGAIGNVTTAGVTGTNGKTTTSFLLRSILQQSGLQTGLLGTIEKSNGIQNQPADMTTPCADAMAHHYRSMQEVGTTHCVAEISSHALDQHRCAAVPLSVAAITNITRDHFDYHVSPDRYRRAKTRIAELLYPDAPILVNAEDDGCRGVMNQLGEHTVITFGGPDSGAELQAQVLSTTHRSQRVALQLAQGTAEVRLRLIGRHNVLNSLCAAGMAEQLGVHLDDIVRGLETLYAVPGRLERIDEGQAFQVLVDYAHTPDALSHCLQTVRPFAPGRLICVFGAGGDRDREKRPLMGQAAAFADFVIVTSDNPRSECPHAIIRQISDGFEGGTRWISEPDRRRAIATAIAAAEPGDIVLVVGKGHESTQEICGEHFPFSDRTECRQLLQELMLGDGASEKSPVFSLSKSA